jgi:uncharacterized protein YybS (DUF2232 family)
VASVLGLPLGLLAPAPLAILCVRRGLPVLLGCVAVGAVALGTLGGPPGGAAYVLVAGVPALLIARGLARGWPPEGIVGAAGAVVAAATLGALHLLLPDGIRPWVKQMVDQTIDAYARQGGPDEMVRALQAQAEHLAHLLYDMLPLGVAATGILLGAASLLVTRAYLARRPVAGVTPFSPLAWYLPDTWIWALIATGALLLVPHDWARIAGANALGVVALAYGFQGWAVTQSIFHAKGVHPLLQAVFYLLMLLWPVLAVFLVLAGVLDVWTDLRKVRPAAEEDGD